MRNYAYTVWTLIFVRGKFIRFFDKRHRCKCIFLKKNSIFMNYNLN